MKRSFPRAGRGALVFPLGLLVLGVVLGVGCAPDLGVDPGAPVLIRLSVLDPSGSHVDMTPETVACVGYDPNQEVKPDAGADASEAGASEAGVEAGATEAGATEAGAAEAGAAEAGATEAGATEAGSSSDGGAGMAVAKEDGDCDPKADGVCTLEGIVCHCDPKDMCDPTIDANNVTTGGTLHCKYAPLSSVVATFDRILDTAPFTAKAKDKDGNDVAQSANVAMVAAMPAPTPAPTSAGTYRSDGAESGLVLGMLLGGTNPHVTFTGSPGFPTDSKVTTTLDGAIVRAKDGKTGFAGTKALDGGKIVFKTMPFAFGGIAVPAPPPPPADMGMMPSAMPMGCPAPMPMDMGGADAGADAGAEAGADAGADAGAKGDGGTDAPVEAGASDGGVPDALPDASVPEVALDASVDAPIDAPKVDAPLADAAASDAPASDAVASTDAGDEAAPAAPSTDVPEDMNTGPVTVTFNNVVGKDVVDHIKVTEDGVLFTIKDMMMTVVPGYDGPTDDAFPSATVVLKPKKKWAAGKTYTVTVDADAADVFGAKLGTAPDPVSFTMSKPTMTSSN
jgi:hypothetical protein